MKRTVWMMFACLLLAVASPLRAQEAGPQTAPAGDAPVLQPSTMPSTDAPAPGPATATATPMAADPPAAAPAKAAEAHKRRYGYLAVFGVASLAAGALALILAGASLLNPFVIASGLNFIERDTDGIVIPGTGTSLNPFYVLGAAALLVGLGLGAAGITMLGLEAYFNDGF